MGTSETEILASKINAYPDEYLPIKSQAQKYLPNNSSLENDGTMKILHRPWIAPLNWGLMLYKGADDKWLEDFENSTEKKIPSVYKKFLLTINGCFIYDLSLFGLTPSIYLKGTFDRTQLQCQDLISANDSWVQEYAVEQDHFHFGSRAYTYDENVGYFLRENQIMSLRINGETVKEWTSFTEFLNDEIGEAENMMLQEIPEHTIILKNE